MGSPSGLACALARAGAGRLGATIEYLDASKRRFVRVSYRGLPGTIRATVRERCGVATDGARVRGARKPPPSTPVLISPYAYVTSSIEPLVEGVVRRSPAEAAGLADRRPHARGQRQDGRLASARREPAQRAAP